MSYINKSKIYFDNGTECGTIEYDKIWNDYKFIPRDGCRFSKEWLVDIAKTIGRLE